MAALAYFITTLRDRLEDKERGATAVEYALLVALVSIVLIGALIWLVEPIQTTIQGIVGQING